MFTRACHLSLSSARCIQPTPSHPISLRSVLILHFHPCLGLFSGLFPSSFSTKILYAFISAMHVTCPAHLILLDLITLINVEKCKVVKLIIQFFSLLGLNILLSTLFSSTFNPCSYLSVRDQVSYPYKKTVKIIGFCI